MKKTFPVLLALIFLLSCSSSTKKETVKQKPPQADANDLFLSETPGQYVIYHDKRGGRNALCGFLKFNRTDYVARRYDITTGTEVVLQFKAVKSEKETPDIKIVQVFKGDELGVMTLLTDMMNMTTQHEKYKNGGRDEAVIKDVWDEYGYTLNHTYRSWIPFFQLYKTEMKGDAKNTIYLLFAGMMKNSKDLAFFNLKDIPETQKYEVFNLKKEGEERKFQFGMFETVIDKNWLDSGINNQYYKGYWVRKKGYRDAQISMEVVPKSMLNEDLEVIARRSIGFSSWVIPSSVKIEKKKNYVKNTFVVLDPVSLNETYMYSIHMKDKNGDLNAFHFSAFKDVYDANKQYFDSIINKLKILQ